MHIPQIFCVANSFFGILFRNFADMKRLLVLISLLLTAGAYAQTDFDLKMREAGLVDLQQQDTTLRVELMYASTNNFMGRNVYGNLKRAYLLPHFAAKVVQAQHLLQRERPGWRLKICDAARPLSVQRYMYSVVKDTPNRVYVANGDRGSKHNYGVAVDVTLLDEKGHPADMGTPVDSFSAAAATGGESALVASGMISQRAADNRWLLKKVMKEAGLVPIAREWWHFEEPTTMSDVKSSYKLLDF